MPITVAEGAFDSDRDVTVRTGPSVVVVWPDTTSSDEEELLAMETIMVAFRELELAARARVAAWTVARYPAGGAS